MRFGKRVFGFAVAGSLLLAIGMGDAHGQGKALLAMKPKSASADTGSPAAKTQAATDLGQINVKAGDLVKPATNDWLSYNGDHTGSRYSALTEITPANVSQLRAKWVFHSPRREVPSR